MTIADQTISVEKQFDVESFSSSLRSAINVSETETEKKDIPINRYFYSVGPFDLLLEENMKAENLNRLKINPVPFTPSWYKGISSVRGIVVPVIDMERYLQIQTEEKIVNHGNDQKKYHMMVEHKDFKPIIFEINQLPKLVNFKPYKKIRTSKKIPQWMIQNYKNDTNKVMQVNHSLLLKQIINNL